MKKAIFILTAALYFNVGNSQRLVLMPQVGIQSFRMNMSTSDLPYAFTTQTYSSPTLGGRLIYFSKNGHGPYAGFRIGELTMSTFDSMYVTSTFITLKHFEFGYQWLSKPVYFRKLWNNGVSGEEPEQSKQKGLAVQFMPSAGLSYTRSRAQGNTAGFETVYRGNIGLDMGLGLGFTNNGRQLFSLNFNYTRSFGTIYNNWYHGNYRSVNGSGWNVTLGVPINLLRKK